MTQPVYPPHPPKLHCCSLCDDFIRIQWELALRSEYDEDNEPRCDTSWDMEREMAMEEGL